MLNKYSIYFKFSCYKFSKINAYYTRAIFFPQNFRVEHWRFIQNARQKTKSLKSRSKNFLQKAGQTRTDPGLPCPFTYALPTLSLSLSPFLFSSPFLSHTLLSHSLPLSSSPPLLFLSAHFFLTLPLLSFPFYPLSRTLLLPSSLPLLFLSHALLPLSLSLSLSISLSLSLSLSVCLSLCLSLLHVSASCEKRFRHRFLEFNLRLVNFIVRSQNIEQQKNN